MHQRLHLLNFWVTILNKWPKTKSGILKINVSGPTLSFVRLDLSVEIPDIVVNFPATGSLLTDNDVLSGKRGIAHLARKRSDRY